VVTGVDAVIRRRRRVRNKWLATAGLVTAAGAALTVWLSRSSEPEPETPTEAVQQYVDAIVSEDLARAWDLTCESEQRKSKSRDHYFSENGRPRFMVEGRRIAGEAVPFEPFPTEAWRVGYHREGELGQNAQELVIRENGHLRVCGDPRHLYEERAGIA
jgi:hypothetical protein